MFFEGNLSIVFSDDNFENDERGCLCEEKCHLLNAMVPGRLTTREHCMVGAC